MKNKIRVVTSVIGALLLTSAGAAFAASSLLNTLDVKGYTTNSSGSIVQANTGSGCYNSAVTGCNPQLVWYGNTSGYGVVSTKADKTDPNHALDNDGRLESLMINFGSSKQLDSIAVGYKGYTTGDADITLLAWKPGSYMDPLNPLVPAPVLAGSSYNQLINAGWELIGNYQFGGASSVNVNTTNPASSSYWLVMAYNTVIGTAPIRDSAGGFAGDSKLDYGKFLSVSYSPGTKTPPHGVPEPSSALLLGAALFGFAGWRSRRLAAK